MKTEQMNEKLKFEILQLVSGHYLCANLPNNWYNLTQQEQNEFLIENNFEPFENYEPEFVWGCIESSARVTQEFIEDLQREVRHELQLDSIAAEDF